jgi:hypothetical protein
MAMDPRKRQKKLDKQKAKKKAERCESARKESQGFAARLQSASNAPILHCCMSVELWRKGMGEVLVSRSLNNGNVAFSVFLVDVYCLVVKDTFTDIVPRLKYEEKLYDKLRSQYSLTTLRPECARKLVVGAVQYALDLGLPPHADYRTSKQIFGDISAEACTERFQYGKDGKPFFIAGPNDDEYRCKHILKTMKAHCGTDNYHFLIPVDESANVALDKIYEAPEGGILSMEKDGLYWEE